MKKVVLLGNIPLATKTLKLLVNHPQVEIIGVVCQKKSQRFNYHCFNKEGCVYDYALRRRIPIFDLKEIVDIFGERELFLGISVRNDDILSKKFLSRFSKGVVNCHGGLLPRYRGLNSANFAILHHLKRFAAVIHYMTDKIDAGPIIARKWFFIKEDDTAYDVFLKVEKALWRLIKDNIDDILKNKDKPVSQRVFIKKERVGYYGKNELNQYKKIDLDSCSIDELYRIVRAFDFPGKEPAYFKIKGKKIYLKTSYFKENGEIK